MKYPSIIKTSDKSIPNQTKPKMHPVFMSEESHTIMTSHWLEHGHTSST